MSPGDLKGRYHGVAISPPMSPRRAVSVTAPSRQRKLQVALLIALCALAARTDLTAERLALRTYGVADGLPQEGVKRIVRDSRGFFWFCTYDGLSRFDGTRFVNYGVRDGLPHPSINDLLETHKGDYWIATNGGGVARFDPSTRIQPPSGSEALRPAGPVLFATPVPRRLFTSYTVGGTPATSRVNVLHEDPSGRIWAGTDDGLFVIEDAQGAVAIRQVVLPFARPFQVWALLDDRAGRLWIGTSEGLARHLPDGRTEIVRVDSGERVPVWTLAEDAESQLWVGLSTGLHVVRAPGASAPAAADGAIQGRISALQRSDDGRMWIGTYAGDVFAADRDGIRQELHLDDAITSLAEDRQGNLWASTVQGHTGAGKLVRHGFTRYDETDGLTRGAIAAILETSAGELCVVRQGRLHRFATSSSPFAASGSTGIASSR